VVNDRQDSGPDLPPLPTGPERMVLPSYNSPPQPPSLQPGVPAASNVLSGVHRIPRPSFIHHNRRTLKPQIFPRRLRSSRRPFRRRRSTRTGETSLSYAVSLRRPTPSSEDPSAGVDLTNIATPPVGLFSVEFNWINHPTRGDG